MQTSTARIGIVHAAQNVLAHDGIRGLYTGLTASIFRQLTYSVTRLGAYDALKDVMSQHGE